MLKSIPLIVLIFLFLITPQQVFAAGTDTFDDALIVLNIAIELDDLDALESLVNPDLGLDIAGQVIDTGNFQRDIHDRSDREFEIFRDGDFEPVKSSFEEYLWGDDGVFTLIKEVTLSHYEIITREELSGIAVIERWEHGELEAAVVSDEAHLYNVYILPDLEWRITFTRVDESWYLTGIAARE